MNRPKWLRKAEFLLLAVLCAAVLVLSRANVCRMGTQGARESVLRQDLQTMRMAIDNYSLDKQHPPQSLQTLVDEKYLRAIPINPFTHKADWVAHNVAVDLGSPKSAIGIDDVHAGGGETDSDRTPYAEW